MGQLSPGDVEFVGALPASRIAVGRAQQQGDPLAVGDGDGTDRHAVTDHITEDGVRHRFQTVHLFRHIEGRSTLTLMGVASVAGLTRDVLRRADT